MYADVTHEAYDELPLSPLRDPSFAVMLRGTATARVHFHGDAPATEPVTPRRLFFVPDGREMVFRRVGGGACDALHTHLRRTAVDRLLAQDGATDPTRTLILPRLGIFDPLLEQLALSVMHAMQERPPGHALHVDRLAQAMAAHLVQHHSTLTRPPEVPKPDGLVDWRLRRLADDIEAELAGDGSLDAMAEQAGLSPLYLTRTFKRAFGRPPHAYLTERRIERAKSLLLSTDLPIAEVALATGFADQSHFTGVFRKLVGTPPGRYRSGR